MIKCQTAQKRTGKNRSLCPWPILPQSGDRCWEARVTSAPVAHSLWATSDTRNRSEEHSARLYVGAVQQGNRNRSCATDHREPERPCCPLQVKHAWTTVSSSALFLSCPYNTLWRLRTFKLWVLWSVQTALYSIVFAVSQGATTDHRAQWEYLYKLNRPVKVPLLDTLWGNIHDTYKRWLCKDAFSS